MISNTLLYTVSVKTFVILFYYGSGSVMVLQLSVNIILLFFIKKKKLLYHFSLRKVPVLYQFYFLCVSKQKMIV